MELQIGQVSNNGQIEIVDKDRLCYLVKSKSRGAEGLRTISKNLLNEFVDYFSLHPDDTAQDARDFLKGKTEIDSFEYGYCSTLKVMSEMIIAMHSSAAVQLSSQETIYPKQVIFYGAPGTGKSYKIKQYTKGDKTVIRTTFHPDSDYSTFVGAYKPTMMDTPKPILDYTGLVDKFKEYLDTKPTNITYACTQFGYDYHDSIVKMQEAGHTIPELREEAYKSGSTYDTQVRAGMATYENANDGGSVGKIGYKFVEQAFISAYVSAWKKYASQNDGKIDSQFLIIEEINRGNCAQIFGDLFQLLDRNAAGFSEYPIKADADLEKQLAKQFAGVSIAEPSKINALYDNEDVVDQVLSGKKLLLPSNLYIWATMNTSDQSLFPIDSAFKRRWDWKYIKIKEGKHKEGEPNAGQPLGWKIAVKNPADDGKHWDWWEFLKTINEIVYSMTSSADKQMGYFFCSADENGEISADTFVNKVVFYLWNDVFKDFAEEGSTLLKYKSNDKEEKDLTFPEFFDEDGKVIEDVVAQFIGNVMKWGEKDQSNKEE